MAFFRCGIFINFSSNKKYSIFITIGGIFFGMGLNYLNSDFFLRNKKIILSNYLSGLGPFFYSSAYFNIIYNNFFEFFFKVSYVNVAKNMEKGFFEFLVLTGFIN